MLSFEGVASHLLVARLGLQRYRLGVFCALEDSIGVSPDAGINRNGRNSPANCMANPTCVSLSKADSCRFAPTTGDPEIARGGARNVRLGERTEWILDERAFIRGSCPAIIAGRRFRRLGLARVGVAAKQSGRRYMNRHSMRALGRVGVPVILSFGLASFGPAAAQQNPPPPI